MADRDRDAAWEGPASGTDFPPEVGGHRFRDPSLLRRALTHCSHCEEHNERLEFLGDAVISMVVAERLVRTTDESVREGSLSLARARVVSQAPLARAARQLGIDRWLLLGTGELRTGGADKDRILCGAFEALIGAVFLDAGFPAAREVTLGVLGDHLTPERLEEARKDPRNQLQEMAQASGLDLPVYRLRSEDGKPHDPVFEMTVEVGRLTATGVGSSKKAAARHAAEEALREIRRFPFVLEVKE